MCVCVLTAMCALKEFRGALGDTRRRGLRTYETDKSTLAVRAVAGRARHQRLAATLWPPTRTSSGHCYLGARLAAAENAWLHIAASASRRPSMSAAARGGMGGGPLLSRGRLPARFADRAPFLDSCRVRRLSIVTAQIASTMVSMDVLMSLTGF